MISLPNTIAASISRFAAWSIPVFLGSCLLAAAPEQSIRDVTVGYQKIDGFLPFYWDAKSGRMWLEIGTWNHEFLYVPSLPAGLGSNDVGLDRGLIPQSHLVQFERAGSRVLLIEKNTRFRSSSSNEMERRAVADSFAVSALWGFDVKAQEGDRALVDATEFLERDAVGASAMLKAAKQGQYKIDPSRCAFFLPRTKGFPKNTEIEVTITMAGDGSAKFVQDVAPDAQSITLRQHHSFIALPEEGYVPRAFDPRAGYFPASYRDYSTPLAEDLDKRFIVRHRLQGDDGKTGVPNRPIVYYVDGGAPQDVRKALIEGAGWWEQAFEAAGFQHAFEVRELPPDADPMDIRYNVVQWVHRFTRGWSYGNAIVDPRTGEILKGQVTLGSLRYRQDYLIFSSLLSPFGPSAEPLQQVQDAVYARLRQLAAHEVGHTLGLAHNFAASADHNASVMDYPHAWIDLKDAEPDLRHAYGTGIGTWDKIAIRYGYTQFPKGANEKHELNKILEDGFHAGHIFITDDDSRPLGSAHPHSHLWDNGSNAVDELERLLRVREAALNRFGEQSIAPGEPMSKLDETLVPLYFLHRYQTEAAGKVLGGLDYTYALRADGQTVAEIVPPSEQRRALQALLLTLAPGTLTLSDRILRLIPPHPPGYDRTRESFPSQTGLTFDPVAAAEAAADLTGSLLFDSARDARLIEYHARNSQNPGFTEVLDAVADRTWFAQDGEGLQGRVKEAVDVALFRRLLRTISNESTSPLVVADTMAWIEKNHTHLPPHVSSLERQFEKNPASFSEAAAVQPPPGQPIGDIECALPIEPSQGTRSERIEERYVGNPE